MKANICPKCGREVQVIERMRQTWPTGGSRVLYAELCPFPCLYFRDLPEGYDPDTGVTYEVQRGAS